jgi:hypothetical protein
MGNTTDKVTGVENKRIHGTGRLAEVMRESGHHRSRDTASIIVGTGSDRPARLY